MKFAIVGATKTALVFAVFNLLAVWLVTVECSLLSPAPGRRTTRGDARVRYVYPRPAFSIATPRWQPPHVNGNVTVGAMTYSTRLQVSSVRIPSLHRAHPEPGYCWSSMRRLAREHIAAGTSAYTRAVDGVQLAAAGYFLVQRYNMPIVCERKGFGRHAVRWSRPTT